jgi:hypothetical protein
MLVTAKGVPSSPILFTLIIEPISCYETPIRTSSTLRHNPEDGILHGLE